ncbi:MAG: hypothetical protein WBG67_12575, partial [Thermoanaerobaculia bacterium]
NSLDVSYTYDDSAVAFSKGRLTAITRAGQSVGYRYDRFGRVTRDGALVYAYDDNGNRTDIGYPGGVTATYTHDFADRQETLTLEDGGNPSQHVVTGAAYKPSGPLTGLTLGNGLAETRAYDQRYFPQRIHVAGLLDWTYTTDAVGNILSITDAEDPAGSRTYGYQAVHYFLTRGDGPWGELSWTYDKIGNRLSEIRDGEANVYQYLSNTAGGHNPKLTEINPGTEDSNRYFYDAAGNQTYRSEGATKQRFSYDAANRLSQILTDSPESAGAITQFRYDGRSFLDTATLAPFPGRPEQFTTTATYSSEGQLHHRATEEPRGAKSPRNAPDRVTASFVLYFAGRPVGTYDKVEETALGGEVSETTNLTFLTTDHLGTPVLTTKAGGNSAWGGGFEPFGTDYSGAQQAGVFLRFPGQWENEVWEGASDGDSLYYNVHRWYEFGTGRYTRADPLLSGNPPGYRDAGPRSGILRLETRQPYGYVLGNPTTYFDELGLYCSNCDDCPSGKWAYNSTVTLGFAAAFLELGVGGFYSRGTFRCVDNFSELRVTIVCRVTGGLNLSAGIGKDFAVPFFGLTPGGCGCNKSDLLEPFEGELFSIALVSFPVAPCSEGGHTFGLGVGRSIGGGFVTTSCRVERR